MRSCVKPTAHSSVNTALLTGDPPKIGKRRWMTTTEFVDGEIDIAAD
jgi:hypothetical protein